MKETVNNEDRKAVVLTRSALHAFLGVFVLVLCILIAFLVALSYAVIKKDNQLEQVRREREVLRLKMQQDINLLETELEVLRKRIEVLDVIEKFDTTLNSQDKPRLAYRVCSVSETYGYDPRLILAVILTESSFNKRAVSRRGCRGLMQLNPKTANQAVMELASVIDLRWEGHDSLFDPDVNVELGAFYLAKLILRFKDVQQGIQAYCDGPSRFSRHLRRGKTRNAYVKNVLRNYQRIKSAAQS